MTHLYEDDVKFAQEFNKHIGKIIKKAEAVDLFMCHAVQITFTDDTSITIVGENDEGFYLDDENYL